MQTRIATVRKLIGCVLCGSSLFAFASTSKGAAVVKHGKEHTYHGKIVTVSDTSITIETHHKKKEKQKTFEITRHTKVEGDKKAGVAGLKSGEHVLIRAKGKHAHVIKVEHHKKKKVAAENAIPQTAGQTPSQLATALPPQRELTWRV